MSIPMTPFRSTAWPPNWREQPAYLQMRDHLQFQDRAVTPIANWVDPDTNRDLARWRNLGQRAR
jgi:hypothetical protein